MRLDHEAYQIEDYGFSISSNKPIKPVKLCNSEIKTTT